MKDLSGSRHRQEIDASADSPPRVDAASLFRAHARFVASFLARLGAASGEIEDLVQEVFLVAHRRGGFLPGAARPTTWLAEIALRVHGAHRRKRRRRPEAPDTERIADTPSSGRTPGQHAEQREALARVQRALEAIDEPRRAVFILFELAGESCDAIAAGLAIPIGTVYSRLHKARKLFREAYSRLQEDEAPAVTRAKRAV
ncbi:MAG: sigma-70 family RNA polymerase sigma factor [Myxococcales bacterium]|nr:sigma-70 family RNA polymerase sigma factor [Myxococcales bacterium]